MSGGAGMQWRARVFDRRPPTADRRPPTADHGAWRPWP